MNLEDAVKKHAEWKMKFRSAIAKKEQMDAATIAQDHCCMVGQWLHGEGKSRWGSKPEFLQAMSKHKAFHTEAGKVARLINAGQYSAAETALGTGTAYALVSGEVGVALLGLKRAVAA